MTFSIRSLVVVVTMASAFAFPSAMIANPAPSWSLASASRVQAGSQNTSTYRIQAWITLPNSCYNSRIVRQAGTNINMPEYSAQEMLVSSGVCPMNSMKAKMVVHCTARLIVTPDVAKTIIVMSRGSIPTKPTLWKVNIGTTPPGGYVACPNHSI